MERSDEIKEIIFQDPAGNILAEDEKLGAWLNFPVVLDVTVVDGFETVYHTFALNMNIDF